MADVVIAGKSAIVTGGSRGIGLATARLLLDLGARVTIGARSVESLGNGVEALGEPSSLATVASDIGTVKGCLTVAERAVESFGGIDILFTNAGVYGTADIADATEEQWDAIVDSNLKGTFFLVQAALPALRSARGAVVTMASDAGLVGVRGGAAAYCAAKAGVANLTRQLALDLAPDVRVNCVAPGFVATEEFRAREDADKLSRELSAITPLGRMGTPQEVARAVVFTLESEFMTGAVISIDGGITAGY